VGGAAEGGAEAGGGPRRQALLLRAPRRALLLLGRGRRRPLLLEVHGVGDPVAARQAAGRKRRHEPLRRHLHHLRLPEARAPPRHSPRVHAGRRSPARPSPLLCLSSQVVADWWVQEFRRTRGHLSSIRDHADLLSSVREDITDSKVYFLPQTTVTYVVRASTMEI
jgi:hypothetical protein